MPETEPAGKANPLLSALLGSTAPRALKLSAARGVLPLMRADLVRVLVLLARDGDDEVRQAAGEQIAALPVEETVALLSDPSAGEDVLHFFARASASAPDLRDAVIGNPATPADALRDIAPTMSTAQIDLMLLNLNRLIETPDLIDLLAKSPSLTPLQRSRLGEIRKHFLEVPEPAPAPSGAAASASAEDTQPVVVAPAAPAGITEPPAAPAGEQTAGEPGTEEEQPEAALIENANQKILRLNTAEKVQLALKGTREERTILIKDSSKLVQMAVLESPKVTDSEIETIAKMRGVTEEVLRCIAGSRDWMKNYVIVHALATNPKTPVGIAMNLVARLNNRDLKLVAGDKNVAELIRRQARKVSDGRNQGKRR